MPRPRGVPSPLLFDGAEALVAFLEAQGAGRIRHSRRTFLAHLTGTAAVLERWGARTSLCKAGLFHSIYGTEIFREALLPFDRRPQIASLLGEEAERLAYVFCAFDRSSIYTALERGEPYTVKVLEKDETIAISPRELTDLVWIVWANELEQVFPDALTPERSARSRLAIAKCAAHLPELARRDLAIAFGERGHGTPSMATLLDASSHASFAADYFPERPFVVHGPLARLKGLVDHGFETLMKIKHGAALASPRTREGDEPMISVQPGQERVLYDAGFALQFQDLSSPAITEWTQAILLGLELGPAAARVSATLSRANHDLRPRYEATYSFVCQAQGTTRWRIAPNAHVRHPTKGYVVGSDPLRIHRVEAPGGLPEEMPPEHEVVELAPGSVMFLPSATWRSVETTSAESMVVTVQIALATWRDAIEYLLTRTNALLHDDLREPVFLGARKSGGPGSFNAALKEKTRAVLEALSAVDIEGRTEGLQSFVASRQTEPARGRT